MGPGCAPGPADQDRVRITRAGREALGQARIAAARRRETRLVYSSVFMVAFGLGTIFGLVLSSWP